MGKLFLYGRSADKNIETPFSKLTVRCQPNVVVQVMSADKAIVYNVTSNHNGEAIFYRLTEGDWDITLPGNISAIPYRVHINSLDYETTIIYFDAVINVTYPEGSICTISNGEQVLHAPDTTGTWSCVVHNPGEYTVTSVSDDGSHTDSSTVQIVSDGENADVILSYFTATIHVIYPEGSICTCTDGETNLTAPNTSGTWDCVVPTAGSWTVTATTTDGLRSDVDTVQIIEDGQNRAITLKFFEAYINITYPMGSTCTVNSNGVVNTAPDISGKWTAVIWNPGEVTVSCTDGTETDSEIVVIATDGQNMNVDLSYFEAYITVTYPAGSACTCSDGITTLTAENTNGSYTFIVPNAGIWTVDCSNGSDTASYQVTITTENQRESVNLIYWDGTLFNQGNQYESVTGGWGVSDDSAGRCTIDNSIILTAIDSHIILYTNNRVRIDNYSKLKVTANHWSNVGSNQFLVFVDMYEPDLSTEPTAYAGPPLNTSGSYTSTLDISKLSGEFYIGVYAGGTSATISKIWLE